MPALPSSWNGITYKHCCLVSSTMYQKATPHS